MAPPKMNMFSPKKVLSTNLKGNEPSEPTIIFRRHVSLGESIGWVIPLPIGRIRLDSPTKTVNERQTLTAL